MHIGNIGAHIVQQIHFTFNCNFVLSSARMGKQINLNWYFTNTFLWILWIYWIEYVVVIDDILINCGFFLSSIALTTRVYDFIREVLTHSIWLVWYIFINYS